MANTRPHQPHQRPRHRRSIPSSSRSNTCAQRLTRDQPERDWVGTDPEDDGNCYTVAPIPELRLSMGARRALGGRRSRAER
jgi:hypothetical protein